MTDSPLTPPKVAEWKTIAKPAISITGAAIPVIGGSLAEVANYFLLKNHDEAMQDFYAELATRVNQLSDTEDLRRRLADPEFAEILTRTVRIAEATSQHDKRVWLANAMVDCLRADAPSNLDRLRNLRLIDQLLPMHIHVLRFLSDPRSEMTEWGTSLPSPRVEQSQAQKIAQAVLDIPDEAYALGVITDLQELKLASSIPPMNIHTGSSSSLITTLPRAESLLKFINEAETEI